MSIMVDLPPQMASEVRDYVTADNEELSRMLFNYLKNDIARRREAKSVMSAFDQLASSTSARRSEAYVFNRADAYAETLA